MYTGVLCALEEEFSPKMARVDEADRRGGQGGNQNQWGAWRFFQHTKGS
jgi:hypothetical protein